METLYRQIESIGYFSYNIGGNSLLDYLTVIFLFLLFYFILNLIVKLVASISRKIANYTANQYDNKIIEYFTSVKKYRFRLLKMLISLFFAVKFLDYSHRVANIIDDISMILFTILITLVLVDLLGHIATTRSEGANSQRANLFYLLLPITKIIVWILAALFVLSNLGKDISGFLATFGIAGVAVALAAQTFLGDLLSFVSIIADKPFEIGDYVVVNNIEGTVKNIGIKSVRIENYIGEEVVVPNSVITKSELHNYKRMNKRRENMVFGIAMDTPDGKLKLIPEIVENICSERDDVEFIRCHFSKISSYSFDFTLAYYVLSPDYHIYSTTRQIINYRIREKFGNMDIAFAYPTNEIIMIDKK